MEVKNTKIKLLKCSGCSIFIYLTQIDQSHTYLMALNCLMMI